MALKPDTAANRNRAPVVLALAPASGSKELYSLKLRRGGTFAKSGGSSGDALADKIIEPVPFYAIKFSVETSPIDAQTGTHDPLPSIVDRDGKLGGQITAWDAQWNGQSFNHRNPKPDGTVPPRRLN